MSGIAEVLVNLGFRVSGSDQKRSSVTDRLQLMGVEFAEGHGGKNIGDAQVVVRSTAVRDDNPEIVEAHRRKATPPQHTKLGGLIYIHGHGAASDWTLGCVALENEHMKELFDSVSVGTPVTIKP